MLQVKQISKKYKTGDLIQTALDGVSLNLRDNEFVAILGPSGSGKTTLLNVIGGLDRYDSGDLVINGISTRRYKDRDWDSYRNHTIGFVFQSYNLIPHQSILSNVELALTISGVSRKERRRRAKAALEQVGLGDQLHKRPNQMSGGQMQRVAIARALVNDPHVLLADEPTGALDSETSVQVMELLKEVARDRLVVMVTHNPELAETYATRIVNLRDGRITHDTHPFEPEPSELVPEQHKNMGKASMSFFTALALSFNNLRTKKARTLLTAFAGSIGIIGIALILSLSTGVNTYITDIQKSTMTSYPISIEATTIDLSSLISTGETNRENFTGEADHELDGVYSNGRDIEMASTMVTSFTKNNLTAFKQYLDDPDSAIHAFIGENGIVYSYDTRFSVYTYDPEGELVNTDGSTLQTKSASTGMMSSMNSMMTGSFSNFGQLIPNAEGEGISQAVLDSYDLLYGQWPDDMEELVLVLDRHNEIAAVTLYELGLLPASEYRDLMDRIEQGEEIALDTVTWDYEDVCDQVYYLLPASDGYEEQEDGTFRLVTDDSAKLETLLEDAVELKISAIVRLKDEDSNALITSTVGYTKTLTDYLIGHAAQSSVVLAQQASPDVNILSELAFSPEDDATRIEDAKTYLSGLGVTEKAAFCREILSAAYADDAMMSARLAAMDESQLAASLDEYLKAPDEDALLSIYDAYISTGSYDENMAAFGMISVDAPASISIYADTFEAKDSISQCIEDYNATAAEEDQISYTDYVALLMSSVTTIINVISYVLIAFVGVSLVVSSIMIGIITYISVLERTKEIGILRAIGASKANISQVFNAETFIIGLCSGLIGVGFTLLLLIPANAIIHAVAETTAVNAALPPAAGVILVILSLVLTLIGGLIPSKKAARMDPVAALRTD